jgi:molybdopterin/thiamine biosynthesis adenylyltransferase/rhodanese-related sulfurtransferase/molybdopterin converting factor small subunit
VAVTVHIPTPLRPFLGDQDTVTLQGEGPVGQLLRELASANAELQNHLFGDDGSIRNFVNVYVNDEDIRYQDGEKTVIKSGDSITIVPSIAGGSESLTPEELARYSRHIIMPNVGRAGQEQLKASSVLLIGAGGLGSPLGLYLAAAGVGRIGMVEFDTVDESNLQRQIMYGTSQIGKSKLQMATARMSDLNPHVAIEPMEEPLTSANALELFAKYDVVADGTDNFPTRYLVNDACVLTGKPNVYGSIFRFEGQISVFNYKGGPCYRCLYSEPPPPGLVPNCAEGGVFGVLPGVIGSMQANEVIKVLLDIGEVASERLVMYDALKLRTRELKLRKNPHCVVCGSNPTVTELIDYEVFCGMPSNDAKSATSANGHANGTAGGIREISVEDLQTRMNAGDDFVLLDVREPWEAEINHVSEEATVIPVGELPDRLGELDPQRAYVVHCKMGGRSARAVAVMQAGGFADVVNLAGGVAAWVDEIDPDQQSY